MTQLSLVILAAGKGTRMKSVLPKVLHVLAGRTLIDHVLHTADALKAAETVLVVGHGADEVEAALAHHPALKFVVQSPQLGTGHALLQAELRSRSVDFLEQSLRKSAVVGIIRRVTGLHATRVSPGVHSVVR